MLKDKYAISIEETYKVIDNCEKAMQKWAIKGKPQQSEWTQHISSSEKEEAEDTDFQLEENDIEIWDCIDIIDQ